jgi:hypothetical protein
MNLIHNSDLSNNQTILAYKHYLLVWLAPDMIALCNYDPVTREVVSLKSFSFLMSDLSDLDSLYQEIPELKSGYLKKILMMSTPHYTLVPENYLQKQDITEKYLSLNYAKNENELVYKDYVEVLKLYNIYGTDSQVYNFFDLSDFDIKMHSITSYLKSILTTLDVSEPQSVYVEILNGYITITLFKYGVLQLCNSYPYKSSEEILYHITNISKHFNIDPHKDIYRFSGMIYNNSHLYNLLYKYIRQPEFMATPNELHYHFSLESIPKHLYFNVFALAQCVS